MVSKQALPVVGIVNVSLLKLLVISGALALFVALGMWQLNRAQEKEIIRDRILAREMMPVLELDATAIVTEDQMYRRAAAHGTYLPQFQVFLDNKVHKGQAGYHVLTPLRIRGGDALLLVNRGWASWGLDRQRAPVAEPPSGEVMVSGHLSMPVRAPISLGGENMQEGLVRVWQNFDMDRYRELPGAHVYRLVMNLESASKAEDLVREWPAHHDVWIKRHQAYAIQWFGIAALFLVIVIFSKRRKK